MTIRQFIKKLFVTIIMIGIVLAAVLKVGYILICKVIVMIIFAVLAIRYWVGEDIRKAEEEKRGTWLFTLGFIGLTVLTMLAANIPGQVQRDQYLYLTKEHTEQLEKVLLREATADSERCIQWYEKQMLGIRNNKALGNPAMQTEDERRYKNRIDGKEVYRDPDTCTLRVKELKDGSTKDSVLINGPVGEIIAMRERIFYIDMEDHNVLKSVTYDGRKRKTWTKDPVKQFAVIGGYVICCTEDEKLIRCDMSTGKRKELADHIQYFFAGAKLYAQKGSKIVSVSYDGKEVRVFKKDVVMMDKKEDKVYYRRMDRKKVPLYGVLELLPLCNLNCDMCYVRMSREEMEEVGRLRTMEEWTKTAEDMMKAGTLFVLLTGGEPLLYPHFRELYQKLRELGMIITINTNGTLIDEAWADFFAENKPRRINITLYGASNETYERLCHYPGGLDKAVNGIRLLRERNIDVKVNGSLAKANVDDRMKIIELGESLDAPVRIDTYMYPSVRERNHAYNNQARLDPEMAAKARVEVLQREMGEEVFAQYRKIQLDEAENTPEGEAVPGQMACRAGKSSFVVNWQGEMRSCVVLDKPSIPLRDVEFEEAWKFTKKETESLRISARCSSCKLRKVCNTCVAAAIAETGKADGVPEYLCRYTEATVRYLKETSKK